MSGEVEVQEADQLLLLEGRHVTHGSRRRGRRRGGLGARFVLGSRMLAVRLACLPRLRVQLALKSPFPLGFAPAWLALARAAACGLLVANARARIGLGAAAGVALRRSRPPGRQRERYTQDHADQISGDGHLDPSSTP